MHGLNEKQRKEVLKLVCNCCNDNITVVDSGEYTLTNTDNIIHVVYKKERKTHRSLACGM